MRIGHGYDVHRLVEDRKLILCGVVIPHTHGLDGHSDADVAAHAVSDSLLGAAGLGDIGTHFPDTASRWKDANSMELLSKVYQMLEARGYGLVNLDLTIIAQKPKLSPYTQQMKLNLAQILKCQEEQINIKATTEEHLGFTGEELGISSHCVCLIESS